MPQIKTTKLYAIVRTKIIFDKKTFIIDKRLYSFLQYYVNNKAHNIKFDLFKIYYNQFGQKI